MRKWPDATLCIKPPISDYYQVRQAQSFLTFSGRQISVIILVGIGSKAPAKQNSTAGRSVIICRPMDTCR